MTAASLAKEAILSNRASRRVTFFGIEVRMYHAQLLGMNCQCVPRKQVVSGFLAGVFISTAGGHKLL